jgi:hypothetical protein
VGQIDAKFSLLNKRASDNPCPGRGSFHSLIRGRLAMTAMLPSLSARLGALGFTIEEMGKHVVQQRW